MRHYFDAIVHERDIVRVKFFAVPALCRGEIENDVNRFISSARTASSPPTV